MNPPRVPRYDASLVGRNALKQGWPVPEILLPRIFADRRHDCWGRAPNSAVMDSQSLYLASHPTASFSTQPLNRQPLNRQPLRLRIPKLPTLHPFLGKPAALSLGLLRLNNGLLWGILLGYLAFQVCTSKTLSNET